MRRGVTWSNAAGKFSSQRSVGGTAWRFRKARLITPDDAVISSSGYGAVVPRVADPGLNFGVTRGVAGRGRSGFVIDIDPLRLGEDQRQAGVVGLGGERIVELGLEG